VGGITIAVHPIVARYAVKPKRNFDDPRGWGRWTTVCLHGKIKQIIIGAYGPTGSGTDTDKGSMWAIQTDQMKIVPTEQRKSNPTFQYMHDIQLCIQQAKKLNYEVILIGDTNINLRNDKKIDGGVAIGNERRPNAQYHENMVAQRTTYPHIPQKLNVDRPNLGIRGGIPKRDNNNGWDRNAQNRIQLGSLHGGNQS